MSDALLIFNSKGFIVLILEFKYSNFTEFAEGGV